MTFIFFQVLQVLNIKLVEVCVDTLEERDEFDNFCLTTFLILLLQLLLQLQSRQFSAARVSMVAPVVAACLPLENFWRRGGGRQKLLSDLILIHKECIVNALMQQVVQFCIQNHKIATAAENCLTVRIRYYGFSCKFHRNLKVQLILKLYKLILKSSSLVFWIRCWKHMF